MDLQSSKWSHPRADGTRAPGIKGAIASWLHPWHSRSRSRSDIKVSTPPISPAYHRRDSVSPCADMTNHKPYSVVEGASVALKDLVAKCGTEIPEEALGYVRDVNYYSSTEDGDVVLFPCPLKEQEAVAAIKGLESRMASAIAELRFEKAAGDIHVDVMKVACFMASAYITTVDDLTKADANVKDTLPSKLGVSVTYMVWTEN